jgi:hypothetical protein
MVRPYPLPRATATVAGLEGLLLFARGLDVLAAGTTAAEAIRSLLIGRTRFLVRTGVLLIVGVTNRPFCVTLLHGVLLAD